MKAYSIEDLNGDSMVRDLCYKDGKASLVYIDGETDKEFSLVIKTDVFYSEVGFEEGSVYIKFLETPTYVQTEEVSEIYIAPKEFGQQIKLTKDGFNLVYGRKKHDWPYFLIIRGYRIILACPIKSIKDIEVNCLSE